MSTNNQGIPEVYHRFKTLPSYEQVLQSWRETADETSIGVGLGKGGQSSHIGLNLGPRSGSGLCVVGAPGSGKTELIRSVVAQIAMRYSAERVNIAFLSIGNANYTLAGIPHTVMTDTDGVDLEQELVRRVRLYASLNYASHFEYESAGSPAGREPFLVVIADEIADLSKESITSLERIGRGGRSLGMFVVVTARLARSIPTELRQALRANVAMRVLRESESLALLRKPLAAEIPIEKRGRGYLAIGQSLDLLQTAYIKQSNSEILSVVNQAFKESGGKRPQLNNNKSEPEPNSNNPAEIVQSLTSRSELPPKEAGEFFKDIEPHLGEISLALQNGLYEGDPLTEDLIRRRIQAIIQEQTSPKSDGNLDLSVVGALVTSLINAAAPFSNDDDHQAQPEEFSEAIGDDPLNPEVPKRVLQLNQSKGIEVIDSAERFGWVPSITRTAEVATIGTAVGTLVSQSLGVAGLSASLISLCFLIVAYGWRHIDRNG